MTAAIEHLGVREPLGQGRAGDRERGAVEQGRELREDGLDAAGAVQVLEQVLSRRPQVGDHRGAPGELVEAVERERHTGAPGEREQMDDGVRATAERHQQRDRVVERRGREDLRGPGAFVRERDGARAGQLGGAHAAGLDGGDRRRAGQAHPERLDERRERRRGAELVAVPERRRRRCLQLGERLLRHAPGAQLVGVVPEVGAGAELAPAEVRGLRRAAGDHDRRHARARGAHELRGHRLVAAAEQHDGVERVGADALLDVHRHEVAEEHRRRLHEVLAERDRRELERQPPGLQDAALDRLGHPAEMQVAVDELRPRVADADHRAAAQGGAGDPLGVQRGTMDEAGEIVRAEPARTPEGMALQAVPSSSTGTRHRVA